METPEDYWEESIDLKKNAFFQKLAPSYFYQKL